MPLKREKYTRIEKPLRRWRRFALVATVFFVLFIAIIWSWRLEAGEDGRSAENEIRKAAESDPERLREVMEQARAKGEALRIPENASTQQMQKRAKQTIEKFYSDEVQKAIKEREEAIVHVYSPEGSNQLNHQISGNSKKGILSPSERIYLFISSNVPQETLRTYASALDRIQDPHIVMVLRGYVDGMRRIKSTQDFAMKMLLKNPGCFSSGLECEQFNVRLEIDPNLFRRYEINQVPAVVYLPSIRVSDESGGEGLEENADVDLHYVIYGDASMEFLLNQIQEKSKSRSLERIVMAMKNHGTDRANE